MILRAVVRTKALAGTEDEERNSQSAQPASHHHNGLL
jgi:hypothetical protein